MWWLSLEVCVYLFDVLRQEDKVHAAEAQLGQNQEVVHKKSGRKENHDGCLGWNKLNSFGKITLAVSEYISYNSERHDGNALPAKIGTFP